MATTVYLVKRFLKSKKRNGQKQYRWSLRWQDPGSGKMSCESTGTADRVQAEEFQKLKWAQVNGLVPLPEPDPDPEPPPKLPTWNECRNALDRAIGPSFDHEYAWTPSRKCFRISRARH